MKLLGDGLFEKTELLNLARKTRAATNDCDLFSRPRKRIGPLATASHNSLKRRCDMRNRRADENPDGHEPMIIVLFESKPAPGKISTYLSMGEALRGHLKTVDGFIAIDRFQNVNDSSRLIAVSYWRDRESVDKWRKDELHRRIQADTRDNVFVDYRLIVAEVLRDYGKFNREQAPDDSKVAFG